MNILEATIGWLTPPQCVGCGLEGHAICSSCSSAEIIPFGKRCWNCGAVSKRCRTCPRCRRVGSPAYVWITTNHEGLARQLLHDYKFDQQRAAAASLADLMTGSFISSNGSNYADYLIVPIPTATSRVRERGFDHSALLAGKIARRLGLEYRPMLGRIGQTRQVGSKRADRMIQMADRFWVKKPGLVAGRKVLLVDDVITTGATLYSSSKTLRIAGAARVDALVFAKRL